MPVDNLYGAVVAAKYISETLTDKEKKNLVVVSPDGGRHVRKFF